MGHIIQGTGDMLLGDGDKNTSPYGGFPLRFSDEKDRGGFLPELQRSCCHAPINEI